ALARLPRLRELSLSTTRISDAGLERLARSPRLEQVVLTLTPTTRLGRLGLQQSVMPDAEQNP
ncbi:MAG: hypothetical protein VX311_10845, partial [Planctomycetota bacterium]|nr:hypothetical protein [Planctomycetota bacterium]